MDASQEGLAALTADVVSAYVSNNSVPMGELATLIADVNAALVSVNAPAQVSQPEALTPAVPVKKSVTPDFIICLDDGKKFKSLKRHLRTAYGMTPQEYRQKWGLPSDYPMVAPNYSKSRSALAQAAGLGQIRRKSAPPESASVIEAASGSGRKSKKAAVTEVSPAGSDSAPASSAEPKARRSRKAGPETPAKEPQTATPEAGAAPKTRRTKKAA